MDQRNCYRSASSLRWLVTSIDDILRGFLVYVSNDITISVAKAATFGDTILLVKRYLTFNALYILSSLLQDRLGYIQTLAQSDMARLYSFLSDHVNYALATGKHATTVTNSRIDTNITYIR